MASIADENRERAEIAAAYATKAESKVKEAMKALEDCKNGK